MKRFVKFDWSQDTKIDEYNFFIKIKISEEGKNILNEIFDNYPDDYQDTILPKEKFYACHNRYANRYEFYIKDDHGRVIQHLPLNNYQFAIVIDDEEEDISLVEDYGIYHKRDIYNLINIQNKPLEELLCHNILKDAQKTLLKKTIEEISEEIFSKQIIKNQLPQYYADEPAQEVSKIIIEKGNIEEAVKEGRLLIFHLKEGEKIAEDTREFLLQPCDLTKDSGIENKTLVLDHDKFFITYVDAKPYVLDKSMTLDSIQEDGTIFVLNLDKELKIENGFYALDNSNLLNQIDWNKPKDFLTEKHISLIEQILKITYPEESFGNYSYENKLVNKVTKEDKILIFHVKEGIKLSENESFTLLYPSTVTYKSGYYNSFALYKEDFFIIDDKLANLYIYNKDNKELAPLQNDKIVFALNLEPELGVKTGFYELSHINLLDRIIWNYPKNCFGKENEELLEQEIKENYLNEHLHTNSLKDYFNNQIQDISQSIGDSYLFATQFLKDTIFV